MTRLINFFDPELGHDMKDIDHSLYIIKWFMTLFAHTLPLRVLHDIIWIDLLSEKVDYLFFIALAILIYLRDRLLLQKKIALASNSGRYENEDDLYEEGFGVHSLSIIQILSGSLAQVLN